MNPEVPFTLGWFLSAGGHRYYAWSNADRARGDAVAAGSIATPVVHALRDAPQYGLEAGKWWLNSEGVMRFGHNRRLELRWRVFPVSDGPSSWPLAQRSMAQARAKAADESLELELCVLGTYDGQSVIEDTLCVFDPTTGEEIP